MKKTAFIALALSLVCLAGCNTIRQKPLVTPSYTVTSHEFTKNDVKKAIIDTCSERKGWHVYNITDSQIEAEIRVRGKHYAAVTIPYDANGFSIRYKASDNLLYDNSGTQPIIHHNYNNWVENLKAAIAQKLFMIGNHK